MTYEKKPFIGSSQNTSLSRPYLELLYENCRLNLISLRLSNFNFLVLFSAIFLVNSFTRKNVVFQERGTDFQDEKVIYSLYVQIKVLIVLVIR